MSIFGTLPIHFQYAIVIGAPVVSLSVGAVLAFFLTRRRLRKREQEVELQVLDESAYHQSIPHTAGAFAASALEASRLGHTSRDPAVPSLDEGAAYPSTHSKELRSSSRAENWSLRSTSATLPPYGPYSPPLLDHGVRGGIRDVDETSKWSSDAAYAMEAPPRAPPATVHRDCAVWTLEEDAYPDVAPPPFESRSGSTRSQAEARHASPVTYRSESRAPLSRPATALSHSRVPRRSPPLSKPPTPYLMQRPGTADGRVGHEPGRTGSPFTSVQRPSTAQGRGRSDPRSRRSSATRTPTPHSARAGPSQRARSCSAPFCPPDGRSRPRRPTLAPLHPQGRGDVSPPHMPSGSREMLLPQEHRSTPQSFTVTDALRRSLTPEGRAGFKHHHVATERADAVVMSEDRWIQARRAADAEADPGPRSHPLRDWAGTPSLRDRGGHGAPERSEDVPLVLRPGYSPSV